MHYCNAHKNAAKTYAQPAPLNCAQLAVLLHAQPAVIDGSEYMLACSEAMSRFEPGTLDMYGASWVGDAEYRMLSDARRYEQYEKYFAGVVCIFLPVPLAIPFF